MQKAGIRIAEPEKNFPRQCYVGLLYSESARSLCHPSDFFENTYDSHGIHEAVKAIREYERLGSMIAMVRRLGYPQKSILYRWYERKKATLKI